MPWPWKTTCKKRCKFWHRIFSFVSRFGTDLGSFDAILYYFMLLYATLCYLMLLYVILCYFMLLHAILYYFEFLFLIWARCIKSWKYQKKCFLHFFHFQLRTASKPPFTSPHLTCSPHIKLSPHTPEHHRPHFISSLIVSPHTTSPHREINGD